LEPKKRLALAIAVIALIAGAMLTSFGRSLFALNTPSIQLPVLSDDPPTGSDSQSEHTPYQKVEVTPQTVQNVIATLERSDSYYREVTIETLWEDGSSVTQVQVWVDGGWTHSQMVLPSGAIRHDIIGNGTLYYWYEGSSTYCTVSADKFSSDLAQRLPTYETVLALDTSSITDAGYESRGDIPCVFVEVARDEVQTIERYWISVDSGLLVSAETDYNGQTIYRMSSYTPITTPCPSNASFSLPDGTLFHSLS
jgi:hypothetical protein